MKNYNTFLQESSFFHSEDEINDILDKFNDTGTLTEEENLILLNYSYNDKPIREILIKMKNLTEKFKELNDKIEETHDKKLMDEWMILNKEMSKYEGLLRYKYKIEDPSLLWRYEEKYL